MNNKVVAAVGVVALAALGYLGATAWSARTTQAGYEARIERIKTLFPFVKVSAQTYERGLFAAHSTTTFELGCVGPAGKAPATATLVSSIRHGRLAGGSMAAAVIQSQLRLSGADVQAIAQAFAGVPFTARTVVGFSGQSRTTFESPAAIVPLGKSSEVQWQGLDGSVDASGDLRSLSYRLKSSGVVIVDRTAPATFRFGAMTFQADADSASAGDSVLVGKAEGTLSSADFSAGKDRASVQMAFRDLKFASDTSVASEMLGGTASFSAVGAGGSAGEMPIERVSMQMSFKRLHAPSYQRLMSASSETLYRCDGGDKTATLPKLSQQFNDDVAALLRHNPEVSIDKLALVSGGLTGEVGYSLAVEGVTEADAQTPLPALLVEHGRFRGSVRVPIVWLRKLAGAGDSVRPGSAPDPALIDAMLARAEAEGMIVREGDVVRSNVEYAKGVLTVNGKVRGPMPGGLGLAPPTVPPARP